MRTVFDRHARVMDLENVVDAFESGATADIGEVLPAAAYREISGRIPGLREALGVIAPNSSGAVQAAAVEFILEGLHLNKKLNKNHLHGQARYRG